MGLVKGTKVPSGEHAFLLEREEKSLQEFLKYSIHSFRDKISKNSVVIFLERDKKVLSLSLPIYYILLPHCLYF
jgi:hypothetical protein